MSLNYLDCQDGRVSEGIAPFVSPLIPLKSHLASRTSEDSSVVGWNLICDDGVESALAEFVSA